jgi:hypothetical protein
MQYRINGLEGVKEKCDEPVAFVNRRKAIRLEGIKERGLVVA